MSDKEEIISNLMKTILNAKLRELNVQTKKQRYGLQQPPLRTETIQKSLKQKHEKGFDA